MTEIPLLGYKSQRISHWIFDGIGGNFLMDQLAETPLADRSVRAKKNPTPTFHEILYLVYIRGTDHNERRICRNCERGRG